MILTGTEPTDAMMSAFLKQGVRLEDYLFKSQVDAIDRLVAALDRAWQEALGGYHILEWDAASVAHPIRVSTTGPHVLSVDQWSIVVTGPQDVILRALAARPNTFVARSRLIELLYPDPDTEPDRPDKALDQHVKRLRAAITNQTSEAIDGSSVICGGRGIYWLRGRVVGHA